MIQAGLWLGCIILGFLALGAGQGTSTQATISALQSFWEATGGAQGKWVIRSQEVPWSFPKDIFSINPCEARFVGLECSRGEVTMLNLQSRGLTGTIPTQIGLLTQLTAFDVSNNSFVGTIPTQIGLLTNLIKLQVMENRLTGYLPMELGLIVRLNYLNLRGNGLVGTIPTSLRNLLSLTYLSLAQNKFKGEFMSGLGQLTKLKTLYVSENSLEGTIPDLSKLTQIEKLSADNNNLIGTIPQWMASLVSLKHINLGINRLEGTIPNLSRLTSLFYLSLSTNSLKGPAFPPWINIMGSLKLLNLEKNQFSGTIISSMGQLGKLESLSAGNNNIWYTIPPWIGNLQELKLLSLINNKLTGSIPEEFGNFPKLETLFLSFNSLTKLPGSFSFMKALKTITINNNNLGGTIPANIAKLTNLEYIYLLGNKLRGSIPAAIGNMTSLTFMCFSKNTLTGTLPKTLGNLSQLKMMGFFENELRGTIPATFGGLNSLTTLKLNGNSFTGKFPDLRRLGQLARLILNDNRLVGSIPSWLCRLDKMVELMLHNNRLISTIPTVLKCMGKLETLNLGNNSLSGPAISPILGSLTNLKFIDFSNNRLTSTIGSALGQLKQLKNLILNGNRIRGQLPGQVIANMTSLEVLQVNSNSLIGTIPSEIYSLKILQTFWINDNKIAGTLSPSISELKGLKSLYAKSNRLSGSLPSELGLLSNLESLLLSNNLLTKTIPTQFGNLRKLQSLQLENNALEGAIPESISQLQKLKYLVLGYNKLVGSIPSRLGSLRGLTELSLPGNRLSGAIPQQLDQLTSLWALDVRRNSISKTLPESILRLPNLRQLAVSSNSLTGILSQSICLLKDTLMALDLSFNSMAGSIPECLSGFRNLTNLQLVNNSFTGSDLRFMTAPNLSVIDISSNQFRGTLPDRVFLLPKLQIFAAAANCLEGSLPSTLCKAASLRVLVLDGLSTATACEKNILPGFTGRRAIYKTVGKIDSCVFKAFPNIQMLHISGNRFSGSIPLIKSWPRNLTDLSLSHNRLTGQLSTSLQKNIAQFDQFDLSFNRIRGQLNHVKLGKTTKFEAKVNRFSGYVSNSIVNAGPNKINVLDGNLFGCKSEISTNSLNTNQRLPKNDPYFAKFSCGSNSFNMYIITFSVLTGVVIMIAAANAPLWALLHPSVSSEDVPHETIHLFMIFQKLRKLCYGFGVMVIFGFLPLYGVLSVYSGTHEELYAWVVSAAFKSGFRSAGVLLMLWVCFCVGIYFMIKLLFGSESTFQSIEVSEHHRKSIKAHERLRPGIHIVEMSKKVTKGLMIFRLVFILCLDLLFMVPPNIGFVLATARSSYTAKKSEQIFFGVLLTLYKQAFGAYILPRLLYSKLFYFGVTDVEIIGHGIDSSFKGGFMFEMFLGALNVIVVPVFSLMVADSNCFSTALYQPPSVESKYTSRSCIFEIIPELQINTDALDPVFKTNPSDQKQTVEMVWIPFNSVRSGESTSLDCNAASNTSITLKYHPSFFYNYQCSTALIQRYSPIFLYMMLMSTFGLPFCFFIAQRIVDCWSAARPLLWLLPRVLMRSKDELKFHSKRHQWDDINQDDMICRPWKTFWKSRHFVVDAHKVLLATLQDIMVLVSFGAVAPLLGLTVVVSIVSRTLRWHHWILEFVQRGNCLDHIVWDLEKVTTSKKVQSIYRARWFLLLFSSIFLSMYLIDIGGDSFGWKQAIWLPLLMWSLPVLGVGLISFLWGKRNNQENQKVEVLPIPEHRISITKQIRASMTQESGRTSRKSLRQQVIELPGRVMENPLRRESGSSVGGTDSSQRLSRHSLSSTRDSSSRPGSFYGASLEGITGPGNSRKSLNRLSLHSTEMVGVAKL